jgi:hypothetical protein
MKHVPGEKDFVLEQMYRRSKMIARRKKTLHAGTLLDIVLYFILF